MTGTDLVWKDESVLKYPRLLQGCLDHGVISGPVDFGSGFAQSYQGILDLHVGMGAVAHRSVLEEFREEQRISADALNGLGDCQRRLGEVKERDRTLTSKSPMVRDFLNSSGPCPVPRAVASVSRPF